MSANPGQAPLSRAGWRWLWLSAAVIVADQLAKSWIVHHFSLYERVRLLPVLDVILTYNTGAAFSFLSDAAGWQRWVFVALALGISVLLVAWLRRLREGQCVLACGLALIVGGALGNMIDRLLHGRVVDFILAHWGTHLFPAFNVADSAITIGAGLVILDALLEGRPYKEAGKG
jgi:signal peptidase II